MVLFEAVLLPIMNLLEAGILIGFTYLTVEALIALIKKMAAAFGGEE